MRVRGNRLVRKEVKLPERLVLRCEEYIRDKGLFSFNELVRLALFLLLEEKPISEFQDFGALGNGTVENTCGKRNRG